MTKKMVAIQWGGGIYLICSWVRVLIGVIGNEEKELLLYELVNRMLEEAWQGRIFRMNIIILSLS